MGGEAQEEGEAQFIADDKDEQQTRWNCTPRYEVLWSPEDIDPACLTHALRKRPWFQGDRQREWVHKRVVALGHEANARGHHFIAHSCFECAFCAKGSTADLISSINMRLKLGQPTLAGLLYRRVLHFTLTRAQRELVERKLTEASAMCKKREEVGCSVMEDEFGQLTSPPKFSFGYVERQQLIRFIRQEGHTCKREREYEQVSWIPHRLLPSCAIHLVIKPHWNPHCFSTSHIK
mmetsp:Transcript_2852/g.8286  ORF Transcript_2852/g.8286 Transcript_2852/m.8286 type:complete len:235 (+) Transcript_2852:7-711(+)